MKQLFIHEVIKNKVEILTNVQGNTAFVFARRSESEDGDTRWGLFNGKNCIHISPYRSDLVFKLNDWGYSIKSEEEPEKLEKEQPKAKVGQKYKHNDGSTYMVCSIGVQFALICIEEENKGDPEYLGDAYHYNLFDNVNDVFGNSKEYFTLLK
jgi:hypothetical protein